MTISKELMLAILSMDAYNRDYGAGIGGLGGKGSKVGTATIGEDSDILRDANGDRIDEDAGFYAVSYTMGGGVTGINSGETVISYRGTDDPLGSEGGADLWTGWTIATGATFDTGAGSQAGLALKFYESVSGNTVLEGRQEDVVLTGHSLGGGLAGLMGSVTGTDATIFDHMPFTIAAGMMYVDPWSEIPLPTYSHIDAHHVTGEALAFGRALGPAVELAAITALYPLIGIPLTAYVIGAEASYTNQAIDSNGGLRDPVALHSQALLISLKFAAENGHVNWQSIGRELWNAGLSDEIGESAGFAEAGENGEAGFSAKLMSAIAYSAIDEGGLVFGNTGIRAMFDDANELGFVYNPNFDGVRDEFLAGSIDISSLGDHVGSYVDIKTYLPQLAVQYAGALALNKIEQKDEAHAVDGIFALSEEKDILALDLSSIIWEDTLGVEITPLHDDRFKNEFFAQTGKSPTEVKGILDKLAVDIWESTDHTIFDRFHMRTLDALDTVHLAERSYEAKDTFGENVHVDLYVDLQDTANNIYDTAGNDMVFGGEKGDVLFSSTGRDYIDGLGGEDLIIDLITTGSVADSIVGIDDTFIEMRLAA